MIALPTEKKIINFQGKKYILFFASLSAIFSFIESILPKPFFFIKIGFAYIPILLIIDKIEILPLISIIILKSIISGIFAGTLLSFTGVLSLIGSIGSIIAFLIAYPFINKLSKVSISILLSFFTNLFQLLFYAFFIIKDFNFLKITPLINFISVITGIITSIITIKIEEKYISFEFSNK